MNNFEILPRRRASQSEVHKSISSSSSRNRLGRQMMRNQSMPRIYAGGNYELDMAAIAGAGSGSAAGNAVGVGAGAGVGTGIGTRGAGLSVSPRSIEKTLSTKGPAAARYIKQCHTLIERQKEAFNEERALWNLERQGLHERLSQLETALLQLESTSLLPSSASLSSSSSTVSAPMTMAMSMGPSRTVSGSLPKSRLSTLHGQSGVGMSLKSHSTHHLPSHSTKSASLADTANPTIPSSRRSSTGSTGEEIWRGSKSENHTPTRIFPDQLAPPPIKTGVRLPSIAEGPHSASVLEDQQRHGVLGKESQSTPAKRLSRRASMSAPTIDRSIDGITFRPVQSISSNTVLLGSASLSESNTTLVTTAATTVSDTPRSPVIKLDASNATDVPSSSQGDSVQKPSLLPLPDNQTIDPHKTDAGHTPLPLAKYPQLDTNVPDDPPHGQKDTTDLPKQSALHATASEQHHDKPIISSTGPSQPRRPLERHDSYFPDTADNANATQTVDNVENKASNSAPRNARQENQPNLQNGHDIAKKSGDADADTGAKDRAGTNQDDKDSDTELVGPLALMNDAVADRQFLQELHQKLASAANAAAAAANSSSNTSTTKEGSQSQSVEYQKHNGINENTDPNLDITHESPNRLRDSDADANLKTKAEPPLKIKNTTNFGIQWGVNPKRAVS